MKLKIESKSGNLDVWLEISDMERPTVTLCHENVIFKNEKRVPIIGAIRNLFTFHGRFFDSTKQYESTHGIYIRSIANEFLSAQSFNPCIYDSFGAFLYSHFGNERYENLNDDNLKKLVDIMSSRLIVIQNSSKNSNFNDMLVESHISTIIPNVNANDVSSGLPEIDILKSSVVLVTNNGDSYSLKIGRLMHPKAQKDVTVSIVKNIYETEMKLLISSMDRERDAFKLKLNAEKIEMFKLGMAMEKKFPNWKLIHSTLRYTKTIYVKNIVRDGEVVSIPTMYKTKFKVGGLYLVPHSGVYSTGSVKCREHFNPNVSSSRICLGDLDNTSMFNILAKLPKALETINLNSAYGGNSTDIANRIFNDGHTFGSVFGEPHFSSDE